MLGEYYDPSRPQLEYIWRAFETKDSLPGVLKANGYHTRAFLWTGINPILKNFAVFDEHQWLFHETKRHSNDTEFSSENENYFLSFWAYSTFPRRVALCIGDKNIIQSLVLSLKANRTVAKREVAVSKKSPISSKTNESDTDRPVNAGGIRAIVAGFINHRAVFTDIAPAGVYTFVHAWGHHWNDVNRPFVQEDGSLSDTTTTLQASARGTLAQVLNIVDDLKHKNQFQDAMIVIHADHGYMLESEVPARVGSGRSRTLLLVKFPGEDSSEAFQEHTEPVSLLDIAPTALDVAGIDPSSAMIGYSLAHLEQIPSDRIRYFYSGTASSKLSESIIEWRIEANQKITRSREISLLNNPDNWSPSPKAILPATAWQENLMEKIEDVKTPLDWYTLRSDYDLVGSRDKELMKKIEVKGEELCQQSPLRTSLVEGVELVDFSWEQSHARQSKEKPTFQGTFLLRLTGQPDFSAYEEVSLALYFKTDALYQDRLIQEHLKPSGFGFSIRKLPVHTWKKGDYVLLTRFYAVPDIPYHLQMALGGNNKIIGSKVDLGKVSDSSSSDAPMQSLASMR